MKSQEVVALLLFEMYHAHFGGPDWEELSSEDVQVWYQMAGSAIDVILDPDDASMKAVLAEMRKPRSVEADSTWESEHRRQLRQWLGVIASYAKLPPTRLRK